MKRFRLGINYWPISSAMYWWQRFDAGEVARDFARIQAAGFDSVRIFLLWEDFQPSPEHIAKEALANLLAVADIAADQSLSLIVTLFTGHMSGINWIPTWAVKEPNGDMPQRFRVVAEGQVVEAQPRNWYGERKITDAQLLLVREVAGNLGQHSALWAWDLGNENSNCVVPPSHAAGVEWLQLMTEEIRLVDSVHPITIGLHMEDLEEDRKIGPKEAGAFCDFLSMHGYPIYARWSRGPTDALLLPFLGHITRWLGGCEVLFEEFGAPTMPPDLAAQSQVSATGVTLLSEIEAAEYTRAAFSLLQRTGLIGGLLWCYGDYARSLYTSPPLDRAVHERYFGVWREDGSAKPVVTAVNEVSGWSRLPPNDDYSWIKITADEFYQAPAQHLISLYREFQKQHELPR